jgi:hypothetical protein
MIFIIWLYKKYHFFVQRLILYLTIAALFDAIGYLMSQDVLEENTFCIVQAFWVTFFDWAVLLWVSCITFNLFWSVIKLKKTNHLEWVYHAISWGVSLVVACIPFSNGIVYGPASLLCWIKAGQNAMRFAIWYVPLFILLLTMLLTNIYITFIVNKRSKERIGSYSPELERNMTLLKEEVKPLRYYPLVFMAANVFPLINRIQNAAAGGSRDDPSFPISLLAILSVPMQGFLNALVYGIDKETRSKLHFIQIKMALQQRRQRMLIGEYPAVGATSTVVDDTIDNDNNPAHANPVNPRTADTSGRNLAVS